MSSCFFSSREKIRISRMSESSSDPRTAVPKVPVPPVISSVALLNMASGIDGSFRQKRVNSGNHVVDDLVPAPQIGGRNVPSGHAQYGSRKAGNRDVIIRHPGEQLAMVSNVGNVRLVRQEDTFGRGIRRVLYPCRGD